MNGQVWRAGVKREHVTAIGYKWAAGRAAGKPNHWMYRKDRNAFERSVGPFHMPAELADGLGLESVPWSLCSRPRRTRVANAATN